MAKFCPSCGKQLQFDNAESCPSCGVQLQAPPQVGDIRNPWIAVLLSFFFWGWGQWYNGRRWDGLKILGAALGTYLLYLLAIILFSSVLMLVGLLTLLFFVVIFAIWIYGMYDAYKTAEKINRKELEFSRMSRLFWLPVVVIVVVIITVILAAVIAAFVFSMAGGVS